MSAGRSVGKPERALADPKEILLGFLDYFRAVVAAKVAGLSDDELRISRLPSGWSPIEMLQHLVFMERRWLVWGFLGEQVEDPRGDSDEHGRWVVADDQPVDALLTQLAAGGESTRRIVERAALLDVAAVGGRFSASDERPTLGWILAYVLQEYARHAGHLDAARELADGEVGE